ncbi:hypothetical protein Tco_0276968 [Tanacetum coccineum]
MNDIVAPRVSAADGVWQLVFRVKVMSTPAYVDLETITQADGTQRSRVSVPLPDDPYVAVRQARVPFTDEELEASEPSDTRTISSHSSASSDSTTPLSPDHPLTRTTPTLASFHRRTSFRSSYETPSPSPSSTLPVRKRYRGTSELILDTDSEGDELGDEDTEEDGENESLDTDDEREGSEDEGPGLEGRKEEAVPEGQQQGVPAADTIMGEPLGLGYGALRRCELAVGEDQPTLTTWVDPTDGTDYIDIPVYVPPVAPVQTLPSFKWSFGSLPVSPSSLVFPLPVALLVTTPAATISVDEDQFLEVGAYYDRDLRELYTRSGAVRDEIFSQRENHDLRMQIAEERHERLELADRVARMERRHESREE